MFDAPTFILLLCRVYRVWVLGKTKAQMVASDMRWTLAEVALIDMEVRCACTHNVAPALPATAPALCPRCQCSPLPALERAPAPQRCPPAEREARSCTANAARRLHIAARAHAASSPPLCASPPPCQVERMLKGEVLTSAGGQGPTSMHPVLAKKFKDKLEDYCAKRVRRATARMGRRLVANQWVAMPPPQVLYGCCTAALSCLPAVGGAQAGLPQALHTQRASAHAACTYPAHQSGRRPPMMLYAATLRLRPAGVRDEAAIHHHPRPRRAPAHRHRQPGGGGPSGGGDGRGLS